MYWNMIFLNLVQIGSKTPKKKKKHLEARIYSVIIQGPELF